MDTRVINRLRRWVEDSSIETSMVPVNLPDTHWCSIIVRHEDKKIRYYDAMHHVAMNKVLASLAHILEATTLHGNDVIMLSSSAQPDLIDCGVFALLPFVRWVVTGHAKGDYRDNALTWWRFGLFYDLLIGCYDLYWNPLPPHRQAPPEAQPVMPLLSQELPPRHPSEAPQKSVQRHHSRRQVSSLKSMIPR
ncbi:Ulp1 protease family C-terminal catalytic domain [Phytophthora infestans]|uniref:Ulp1 protease family C-terminal catalytic domain n=1 Tax=Phytophthora infestans TaxID=4787 RepID=A0A833W4V7_PHYIN|nr:Ulp1 protease family C-terminal catalytic domain [Phytophthora infestans]KAF4134160.1 Ulp1 protease family C-terminal catalytic domain-containing protein [Phytophthora infestans]